MPVRRERPQRELANDTTPLLTEEYGVDEIGIWRRVRMGELTGPASRVACTPRGRQPDVLRKNWDQAWLRGQAVTAIGPSPWAKRDLTVVDLFAGCGGMSLGVRLAAEAIGLEFKALLAADLDETALGIYKSNLNPVETTSMDLAANIRFVEGPQGSLHVTQAPQQLRRLAGRVDLLIGGPPCQGHSDLNNHSRRKDPKNKLYLLMPAIAALLKPRAVIIENVPAVVHDRNKVVKKSEQWLKHLGYETRQLKLTLSDYGIAQRRQRHVLIAFRPPALDANRLLANFETAKRSVRWAIGDLGSIVPEDEFDIASKQSAANEKRIAWLFGNDAYDLPNEERPKCHRDKSHSYVSMYGRMKWSEPAQTVTSGYGSPGQGRYVHPGLHRTLTPHEAARLQFFPDSFKFVGSGASPSRSQWATMIGNAVPPKLSYVLGLAVVIPSLGQEMIGGTDEAAPVCAVGM